jgi:hypothetical protein
MKVYLSITKVYIFNMPDTESSEAVDKASVVAERRLKKNMKKIEGEIDMREIKGLEKWHWEVQRTTG